MEYTCTLIDNPIMNMQNEKSRYKGLTTRRRDGFMGEKQIILPRKLLKERIEDDPLLNSLYITLIGYFPKASYHYRERRWGCRDNILFYCVDGKGWYENKSGYCEIKANEFVILPATDKYLRYGAHAEDPWSLYWVHFCGTKIPHFNQIYNLDQFLTPTVLRLDERRISLWEEMYNTLEMGYSLDNLSYANFCLYHYVASFIFRNHNFSSFQKKDDNIITKAILFMRENLDKRLWVDDIAEKFSYSASHFSSLFKKQTGFAPLDYFIHLKMQKACQLLDLSDMKVKDIAAFIGYDDPYFFNRIFNKVIGMSPSEYRKTNKS